MARIVIAASPLSGHVLPMVLIGAHLRGLGHAVAVLTDEGHRRVVERAGLEFKALGQDACPDIEPSLSRLHRLWPNLIRRYFVGKANVRATFVAPLVTQYRALTAVLDAWPADAVLVDLAFTGVLPMLTANRPRPAVLVCGVGPLTLSSADTPPFGMSWIPRPGVDYRGMHTVVRHAMFRDVHTQLAAALDRVGSSDIAVSLMDWPRLADRLLQLTVPEFEYPRSDLPANVEFVGPVLPETDSGYEPPRWWKAVLRARTVVHVTQGTLNNEDLRQLIQPSLRALADAEGVVVVATTGRTGDRQALRDIPSNAYVAEWIPYSVLLPQVDVMITNGGYGGVQHALRYGIPVVVAGESADKAEVAARVEYAGVGVNLGTAHPAPDAIVSAVRHAAACRDAARLLGDRIAGATPLGAIAEVVVEEIARQRAGVRS